ncbi:MAG: DUF4923 family protein [Bacteroides sp.]|jgi:hypothetical protein|nr:DUF4923 family protein [Bacteroides sp.]
MKKYVFSMAVIALALISTKSQAQSLKSLFGGVEKAVNTITGTNTADITGTWTFTGSAVEFKSENLLMKAGGSVASSTVEGKIDQQLRRVGITAGKMTFTFNTDSTFNAKVGTRNMNGTYSYEASAKKVNLKFVSLIGLSAKVNCTSDKMDLLFNSDKLLKLITFLSSKSSNTTLKSISSLSNSYDGMLTGFSFKSQK